MEAATAKPDTIIALTSGALPCAVAVVRLSGERTVAIAQQITGKTPAPRRASLCQVRDGDGALIDEAIVIYFPAPRSYTGEDVLEVHTHGSAPVVHALIDCACAAGARHARPGEFTERAYFNGRLDLVQAEAVADLISAQTMRAARAAHNSLRGTYSRLIEAIQRQLTEARVLIEAAIDFPEEDLPAEQRSECADALGQIRAHINQLRADTDAAIARRHGLTIALVGEPNAGKSTLLNALSGEDLAIVSGTPGTTRDAIAAEVSVHGQIVRLTDTAGIRSGGGDIEREGMRRARELAAKADRVWWVRAPDNNEQLHSREQLREQLALDDNAVIDMLHNKIDLSGQQPALQQDEGAYAVQLSAHTGGGLELVHDMVAQICHDKAGATVGAREDEYSARRRHSDALAQADTSLARASDLISAGDGWELIAEELRLAQLSLDGILGKVSSDDLLGEIFARFCIGK